MCEWVRAYVRACVCILQNWVSDAVIHSIHYPVSDDTSAEFSGTASDPAAGWGGARNMKSMWPPLAAIFFMTYLYRAGGGGHGPLGTPPRIRYCGNLSNRNARLRICVILSLKNRMLYNVVFSASQKGFFHPLHVVWAPPKLPTPIIFMCHSTHNNNKGENMGQKMRKRKKSYNSISEALLLKLYR